MVSWTVTFPKHFYTDSNLWSCVSNNYTINDNNSSFVSSQIRHFKFIHSNDDVSQQIKSMKSFTEMLNAGNASASALWIALKFS